MADNRTLPKYYDPDKDLLLDARTIRGLAHPLRVRILGLLREFGPATATDLGRRLGFSSGVTSYHLRQLAEYGLVEDAADLGNARERWWRSRHRSTYSEFDNTTPETAAASEVYLRAVAQAWAERVERYIDSLATVAETLGPEWTHAGNISDKLLWLTPAETEQLSHELDDLAQRYSRDPGASKEGRQRVVLQYQVLPQIPSEGLATGTSDDV